MKEKNVNSNNFYSHFYDSMTHFFVKCNCWIFRIFRTSFMYFLLWNKRDKEHRRWIKEDFHFTIIISWLEKRSCSSGNGDLHAVIHWRNDKLLPYFSEIVIYTDNLAIKEREWGVLLWSTYDIGHRSIERWWLAIIHRYGRALNPF